MKRIHWSVIGPMVAAMAGGTAARAVDPAPVTFEQRVFASKANAGESLPYVVAKPADWDAKKTYPLLVFLHGAGERGDDNQAQLKWGREWMEKAVREFHAVVVAPQCPPDARWVEADWSQKTTAMPKEPSRPMRLLFELLGGVEKEFSVDPARRYVAGLSMGGYGTWDALCRRPGYFAAGVPICGGGDENQAKAIVKIPVWVFHGAKDSVVPVVRARNMVAALKKAGGTPKYTEYPDVDHFSWVPAFAEPDLLKWLFAQKRNIPATAPK
ncbi:MAG: alpha/beta hydrolase-fold protein [Planctomycetota bacterium]|nr:alpha/beta hydrolase-fold protein [Planctomycetota bacterium]